MTASKKEKTYNVYLKQKRPHQTGFRLGRHLVKLGPAQSFELNEAEKKELETVGPKTWLKEVSKKEALAKPKSNADNKKIQDLKKYFAGKEIELKGSETLDELQDAKVEVEMREAVIAQLEAKEIKFDKEASTEELEALLA